MKIKNEQWITNIDLTITIKLITLFITIIATLIFTINRNSTSVERGTEATNYAINEIENLKAQDFESLTDTDDTTNDFIDITDAEGQLTGYSKKITITDYANLPENQDDDTILSGLVKKVTVEISYKDGDTIETVDLSTVISKND